MTVTETPTRLIAVVTVGHQVYRGPVDSRTNVSNDPDLLAEPVWYVQFHHDEQSAGRTGDPAYWKQGIDPGTIQFVEA